MSDVELRRLVNEPLAMHESERVENHLESCAECRNRVDAVAGQIPMAARQRREVTDPAPSKALSHVISQLQSETPSEQVAGLAGSRNSFLSPASRPNLLGLLGKYEILCTLGEGGMGIVFSARDPDLNREVAIKVPSPSLVATQEARDRFFREVRAIAAMNHDNIVTVYAVDDDSGTPFLVMEKVVGESLADRLQRASKLSVEEAIRLSTETAAALQAAHDSGLVHRDIKPANILLVQATGRAKVTDFGLAKSHVDVSLSSSGVVAGTPEFMSPEQADEQEATKLSDLFSLGTVLYAACTGKSPFRDESTLSTLQHVRDRQVKPLREVDPSIPKWFSELVAQLMSKEPKARPQSAAEVIQRLSLMRSSGMDVSQPRLGEVPSGRASPSPSWRRVLAIAVGVLATGALVAMVFLGNQSTSREQIPSVQSGFLVKGVAEPYSSLQEAIFDSRDGIVQVQGDGPFLVPCLATGDKRLSIRAAEGSRPVFVPASRDSVAVGPFLTATADVELIGVEVRWQVKSEQPISFGTLSEVHELSVVHVDGGDVVLRHCRLVVSGARRATCIYLEQGSADLQDSHLVSPLGTCCLWGSSNESGLRAENCVLQAQNSLMFDAVDPDLRAVELELISNTFVANRAIQIVIGDPLPSLRITAARNLFDTSQLITFLRPPVFRGLRLSSPEFRILVNYRLDWRGSANVYPSEFTYLARGSGRSNARTNVLIADLEDWQTMWNQPDSGSQAVTFEEPAQAATDSNRDDPFARVRSPAVETDERAGADLQRVGPAK